MLTSYNRLRDRKDFRKIYRRGKSKANDTLVLYFLPNKLGVTRVGFSVSKKIGNAVGRNFVKRRLREVCRDNISRIKPGYDIIFIARQKIKGISYELIEVKVLKLIERVGLLKTDFGE